LVTKLKEEGTKESRKNKKKDYNLRNQVSVEFAKRRSDKFDREETWIKIFEVEDLLPSHSV